MGQVILVSGIRVGDVSLGFLEFGLAKFDDGAEVFFPFWYALPAVEESTIEEGGDGDRSQGCTGPRGRTLREDQALSVLQSGVTPE